MKKIFFLCALFIVVFLDGAASTLSLDSLTLNAAALVSPQLNAQPALTLIFRDEFNGGSVNADKWMTQLRWGRTNPPEMQYYSPSALKFSGGALHIKAEHKSTNGMPYVSGVLTTFKSFQFTYGVVQIRARTPAGKGLWPALWLLDYAGGAQEIDIMESVGHEPNIAYMTLHYPTSTGTKTLGGHYGGASLTTDFHLFTVDWGPNAIIWYIDGVERYRLTQHIPTKPMYLIMNLAVGGDWPGAPSKYTKFPAYFNIDYVRIYKKQ